MSEVRQSDKDLAQMIVTGGMKEAGPPAFVDSVARQIAKHLQAERELMGRMASRVSELESMLSVCCEAIESLGEDDLGYTNDGDHEWPNRDELAENARRVLEYESTKNGEAEGGRA